MLFMVMSSRGLVRRRRVEKEIRRKLEGQERRKGIQNKRTDKDKEDHKGQTGRKKNGLLSETGHGHIVALNYGNKIYDSKSNGEKKGKMKRKSKKKRRQMEMRTQIRQHMLDWSRK